MSTIESDGRKYGQYWLRMNLGNADISGAMFEESMFAARYGQEAADLFGKVAHFHVNFLDNQEARELYRDAIAKLTEIIGDNPLNILAGKKFAKVE